MTMIPDDPHEAALWVKKRGLEVGADLVGIAPMTRWEGAPKQMDPRYIMPEAKSCIGLAFRVLRGSLRGIEEGTFFSNYSGMGYGGITYIFMPIAVNTLAREIEDNGYEAFPMGHQSDWRAIDNEGNLRKGFSKPVAPGKPAPDIMVHLRIAGYLCGLGEIGWSKMFLTKDFGPLQRVAFIFTDAELEPDPLYSGKPLCRRCMACVRECPGGCLSRTESIKVSIGGKICEWGKLDEWRCYAFYTHGGRKFNPFVPKKVWDENENGDLDLLEGKCSANEKEIMKVYRALEKYFPTWVGYNMAKCGGCIRACVSMLEKKGGCMEGRFKEPLRTGKAWVMDR